MSANPLSIHINRKVLPRNPIQFTQTKIPTIPQYPFSQKLSISININMNSIFPSNHNEVNLTKLSLQKSQHRHHY
jgi:hypothetical protein